MKCFSFYGKRGKDTEMTVAESIHLVVSIFHVILTSRRRVFLVLFSIWSCFLPFFCGLPFWRCSDLSILLYLGCLGHANAYSWLIEMSHLLLSHCQVHCGVSSSSVRIWGVQSEVFSAVPSTAFLTLGVLHLAPSSSCEVRFRCSRCVLQITPCSAVIWESCEAGLPWDVTCGFSEHQVCVSHWADYPLPIISTSQISAWI